MGARDFYQDFFPKVAFFKRNDSKKWPFCCQRGICWLYFSQELAATAEDVLTGRTTTSNIFRDFPGKTTEAL